MTHIRLDGVALNVPMKDDEALSPSDTAKYVVRKSTNTAMWMLRCTWHMYTLSVFKAATYCLPAETYWHMIWDQLIDDGCYCNKRFQGFALLRIVDLNMPLIWLVQVEAPALHWPDVIPAAR